METVWKLVLILSTYVLCVLRFALPTHNLNPQDIFKDIAHVYVGILIGLASKHKSIWFLVAILIIVEVIAVIIKVN